MDGQSSGAHAASFIHDCKPGANAAGNSSAQALGNALRVAPRTHPASSASEPPASPRQPGRTGTGAPFRLDPQPTPL